MLKLLKLFGVFSLLATSQTAIASEWWFVASGGQKPHRTIYFVDKAGIRGIAPNRKQAWQSLYNEAPEGVSKIVTEKQFWEFDCEAHTASLMSYIEYAYDGSVIRSEAISTYSRKTTPMAPDTVGESSLLFVCGDETNATKIESFDQRFSGMAILAIIDKR